MYFLIFNRLFAGNGLFYILLLFLSLIEKRFIYVYNGTKPTRKRKRPFRQNFKFYKGSTYVVLSRAYVNFTLHDQLAKDFLKWVKNTGIPDETYYATLYMNTGFDKCKSSSPGLFLRNNLWEGGHEQIVHN